MKLRPEEIASVLREQIENYQAEVEVEEVGTVLEVGEHELLVRRVSQKRILEVEVRRKS